MSKCCNSISQLYRAPVITERLDFFGKKWTSIFLKIKRRVVVSFTRLTITETEGITTKQTEILLYIYVYIDSTPTTSKNKPHSV